MTLAYTKCMGFSRKRVWGMGYSGPMGYGLRIPANQLGGWRGLWGVRGYGLFPIWVMRGSTVPRCHVPEDQPPSRLEPTYNMEHDSDGDPLSSLLAMLRAKTVRDFKNRGMSVA